LSCENAPEVEEAGEELAPELAAAVTVSVAVVVAVCQLWPQKNRKKVRKGSLER
jgi:hypothetical protein